MTGRYLVTGYYNDQIKQAARKAGAYWAVLDKAKRNKKHASIRAKVEHIFCIVNYQFVYRKTRYKGLAKNAAQVFSLTALAKAKVAWLAATG